RSRYQHILEGVGCHVISVADGHEALLRALVEPPALVLTDIDLPLLDGHTLCEVLRRDRATADVPILVVANQTPHIDARLKDGVMTVLAKPASNEDILRETRRLMTSSRALRDRSRAVRSHAVEQLERSTALIARSALQ